MIRGKEKFGRVCQYDGEIFVGKYGSIKEASEKTGCNRPYISRVLMENANLAEVLYGNMRKREKILIIYEKIILKKSGKFTILTQCIEFQIMGIYTA